MGIFDFFKKKNKEEIAKESKIEEKNKNGIMSHLENFKSSLYKNKFIGNYKLFNWNIWLVSEGEKIAKTFVKVFEKELINIYDENGNKFYVDEKTEKFVLELKDDTNIFVNIRSDDYALETSMAMANYFSDAKIEDEYVKKMVIAQLQGFDCNVKIDIIINQKKMKGSKNSEEKLYDIMQKIIEVCEEHKAYFSMDMNEIKRYE